MEVKHYINLNYTELKGNVLAHETKIHSMPSASGMVDPRPCAWPLLAPCFSSPLLFCFSFMEVVRVFGSKCDLPTS